ncbi:hypothetical protein CJ030_MR3G018224 [Morella rubra]|uniref:GRF-type domain-containing protein n=1 Tax=Morella rubra TaxID=262757 RepID=A0A6A1W0X6_9ROSI|nr:hypothetical protein CJ030_MR5G009777 [Morella rubra]KAB1218866.1 hypothetical protein CJ030_MR3G018257 [Morella rubra]KAB1218899.1 hypothetical protein CJ030_MR3G018224 [Morella rubra]
MSRRVASSFSTGNGSHGGVASAELEVDGDSCLCFYELKARMMTSKTRGNPGRRFFDCSQYSNSSLRHLACNFFEWIDPPHFACGEVVIVSMVRKMKITEEELYKSKAK